jgi:SprT protein
MELKQVECLAKDLIHKYLPDYSFNFDNAKKRFGCHKRWIKNISLSAPLCLLNNEETIKNMILHEIAHGLSSKVGHNAEFYNKCREIGAIPSRTYKSKDVVPVEGKHQYKCPGCGKITNHYRKLKRSYSCSTCNPKRYDERFKLMKIN